MVDRTYAHVDRGSVRKLLTQANWIEECGILVDMDAAYALLPSGLAVLSSRSAQLLAGAQARRKALEGWISLHWKRSVLT